MWRDIDPRAPERERPEPGLGRVGGYTDMESGQVSDDPRDVFTRDLDLPRGSSRERVRVNGQGVSGCLVTTCGSLRQSERSASCRRAT